MTSRKPENRGGAIALISSTPAPTETRKIICRLHFACQSWSLDYVVVQGDPYHLAKIVAAAATVLLDKTQTSLIGGQFTPCVLYGTGTAQACQIQELLRRMQRRLQNSQI